MKKPISDYDQRQYRLMLEQITGFESGRIILGHLVGGLESLSAVLEERDASWDLKFSQLWGILDNAYANLVTKSLTNLSAKEQELVEDTVRQLKILVEAQLSEMPS
jgi:hypothetical protein